MITMINRSNKDSVWLITWLSAALLFLQSGNATGQIMQTERSLYRNIIVTQQGDLRCLKFSTRVATKSQSCINLRIPNRLVFYYTQFLMASLLLNDQPRRILIIGLGGGTMSNALHRLLPNSLIENVEIDPAVIRLARKYFHYIENDRVSTVTQDGRIYIKRALRQGKRYDLIILDAYNGDYIPEHLMTREFLEETGQLLSANGVLAANTFSRNRLYGHESATYHSVFGSFINISSPQSGNRVIVASHAALPSPRQLDHRAQQLARRLLPYNVDMLTIRSLISTTPDWDPNTRILTDQYSPANLLQSGQ